MEPYRLDPSNGDPIWMFDSLDTIKADASQTNGAFAAVEFRTFENSSPPLHVHTRFDNGLFVLEGNFTFVVAEETFTAGPGTWVFVPRDVARTWRCESAEGRMLSVTAPAGFEDFYRHAGERVPEGEELPTPSEPDAAALATLAAEYGTSIIGPPIGVA